jgi:predicted transcriptional regulator
VAQAQPAVRGVGARELRDSGDLRQRVASELSVVRSALDGMLEDRPRRKIIRPNVPKEARGD